MQLRWDDLSFKIDRINAKSTIITNKLIHNRLVGFFAVMSDFFCRAVTIEQSSYW